MNKQALIPLNSLCSATWKNVSLMKLFLRIVLLSSMCACDISKSWQVANLLQINLKCCSTGSVDKGVLRGMNYLSSIININIGLLGT